MMQIYYIVGNSEIDVDKKKMDYIIIFVKFAA